MYKDLREWLEEVDKMGELRRLNGADWDVEIGAISAMSVDAVLCDNIVGYPPGYRILANPIDAIPRWLLMQNWSTKARENALCREWKERLQSFKPVKVKWVDRGPILENIQQGDDIDVFKFPVPKIHPGDAGRYIGSCDSVILKDSDTGRVNLGTYRMQVHDKSTLALYMSSSGKDGAMILKKHQEMQKPCPVLVLVGIEPAIYYASNAELTHVPAFSEYEFAGWLKGAPIEVIKGEFTGLPIPAYAEIAIEGESLPGERRLEGPFGEWTGYGEPRQSYVLHVKRVYHRNNPILTMQSPSAASRPPSRGGLAANPMRAGIIWDQMERAGVRGIQGVAIYGARFLTVVSIKNTYAGQSRQAGHIATQCHASAFMGKYTIVVDEDVDPYNLDEVVWAVIRRADPQRSIDILRYCWSDPMDCALSLAERTTDVPLAHVYNSRCIIDACKPAEWAPDLKKNVVYSSEIQAKVIEKFGNVLFPDGKPRRRAG